MGARPNCEVLVIDDDDGISVHKAGMFDITIVITPPQITKTYVYTNANIFSHPKRHSLLLATSHNISVYNMSATTQANSTNILLLGSQSTSDRHYRPIITMREKTRPLPPGNMARFRRTAPISFDVQIVQPHQPPPPRSIDVASHQLLAERSLSGNTSGQSSLPTSVWPSGAFQNDMFYTTRPRLNQIQECLMASQSLKTSIRRMPLEQEHSFRDHPTGIPSKPDDVDSGRSRAMQDQNIIVNLDNDRNPNQSDLVFDFERVNGAASHTGFGSGVDSKDYLSDAEFGTWLAKQEQGDCSDRRSRTQPRSLHSQVPLPRVTIDQHTHNGIPLRTKVCVEMTDGDFMRIIKISQNPRSKEVFLGGQIYRRMTFMNGILEKKLNEVCWISHIIDSDSTDRKGQVLQEISVNQVVRRRSLRLTNRPFPQLTFRDESNWREDQDTTRNERVLVCRWKYICTYRTPIAYSKNIHSEKALIFLREDETDRGLSISDNSLRHTFRGETIPGGASHAISTAEFEHQRLEKAMAKRASKQDRKLNTERHMVQNHHTASLIDLTVDIDLTSEIDTISLGPPDVVNIEGYARTGPAPGTTEDLRGAWFKNIHSFPRKLRSSQIWDHHYSASTSPSKRRGLVRLPMTSSSEVGTTSSSITSCSTASSSTSSVSTIGKESSPSKTSFGEQLRSDILHPHDGNALCCDTDTFSRKLDSSSNTITSESDNSLWLPPVPIQRYTMGDGFCGAGGVSRGATMAGLRLQWSFDCERPMCVTYHKNFPTTDVYQVQAFEFATDKTVCAKIDCLHLSPPCQFFSPAHTTEGQNDERNTASSFVIAELLKKAKPRIVTLENTLGLEQRHPLYLHAVIQQFTALGFSIRWGVIDLRDFGVPQSRRRLILIAAWYWSTFLSITAEANLCTQSWRSSTSASYYNTLEVPRKHGLETVDDDQ